MAANRVTLTRNELYEQVWSEPMQALARRYGMSDRGLAKNCAAMRVPVPGRGYWAKKAVGKAPPRTPLPELPPNSSMTPKDIELTVASPSESIAQPVPVVTPPTLPEPIALQSAFETDARNRIVVPATLRNPHKLVQRSLDAIHADGHHTEPDWQYKPAPRLAIDVSAPLFKRAIRIMDALLKAFDRREWNTTVSRRGEDRYKPTFATWVSVLGHQIHFGIREPTRRVRSESTATSGHASRGRRAFRDERVGRLALAIYSHHEKVERELLETEDAPLEAQLNDFVIEVVTVAHNLAEAHRQRVAEWQRETEAQRRREEERRRLEGEAARVRALERQALEWAVSANLLAYVAELRRSAQQRPEGLNPESPIAKWIDWAESHAKARDPFAQPLEDLAADRVAVPDPYARQSADYTKPPTPYWFFRKR